MDALDVETRDGLRRVPLEKARMTIGRLPGNDIVLPFAQISRHHAEVRQRDGDWWIIDLGSTNGLRVAGRVVKEYLLRPGDTVLLAPAIVVYFVSQRARRDIVEGSTIPMPSVTLPPPAPGASIPLAARASTLPQPAVAPAAAATAGQIAHAAAVPLPKRGFAPPPSSEARHTTILPPLPGATPPLTETELDTWLNDQHGQAAPQPAASPRPTPQGDLPLQSPFAILRQQGERPAITPKRPLLYRCPICGERTAPDSPYCWSCRTTIALPCPQCHLYLLPIQSRCPRCESPNPHAVRR